MIDLPHAPQPYELVDLQSPKGILHWQALTQRYRHLDLNHQALQAKVAQASENVQAAHVHAMVAQAKRELANKKTSKAITWIHKAVDKIVEPLASLSPCKSGCNHCCHQYVSTTDAEARLIAQHTGLHINTQAGFDSTHLLAQERVDTLAVHGSPCLFLKNSQCAIYSVRPAACRTHLSADSDDLLCQLVKADQAQPRAIYMSTSQYKSLTSFPNTRFDDIRNWFKAQS